MAAIAQQQKGCRLIARAKIEMAGNVHHRVALPQRGPHGRRRKGGIQFERAGQHAGGGGLAFIADDAL